MDAQTFLDNFATIAEAPGGVRRLRELVLDLALRGDLSDRRATDTSVNESLSSAWSELKKLESTREVQKLPSTRPVDDPPHEVPASWRWEPLGRIAAILDFRRQPVKQADRMARVQGRPPEELYPYYGATQQAGLIDDYLFDEELALLGEDGAPFLTPGKHVAYVATGRYWVNNHAHVLRGLAVTNRYLIVALNRVDFTDFVTGTTRLKLTQGKMVHLPVPVPPLAEQERIVAKVDELMGLCDDLEAHQQRRHRATTRFRSSALHSLTDAETPDDLHEAWERVATNWPALTRSDDCIRDLRQTILELAVAGRLTATMPDDGTADDVLRAAAELGLDAPGLVDSEGAVVADPHPLPPTWAWVTLGSVVTRVLAGWSAPSTQQRRTGDEWAVLKVSACTWGSFRPEENKALTPGTPPREELEVHAGDLLITRANTSDLVARSVVVEATPPHLMLSDKTLRLTPVRGCNPRYLNLANLAPVARAHYRSEATGTSDSMKNVSQRAIRRTPIPLPPSAEQDRIVTIVDQLNQQLDRLEAATTEQRWSAQRLAEALAR